MKQREGKWFRIHWWEITYSFREELPELLKIVINVPDWLKRNQDNINQATIHQQDSRVLHISLSITCSLELQADDFVYNVVPDLRVCDAIQNIAGQINHPAHSLILISPNGSLMYPYNLISYYGLCNGDSLVLQSVNGHWHKQDKMIIRPEHAGPAFDQVINSLRSFTQNILQSNPPNLESIDIGTLYHSLASILSGQNKEVFFFDSRLPEYADHIDQSHLMNWGSSEADNVDIIFGDISSFSSLPLQQILSDKIESSRMKYKLRQILSEAFEIDESKFSDMTIFANPFRACVNGDSWTLSERNMVISGAAFLETKYCAQVQIHPLFKSCKIDIALFDYRGDKKDFSGGSYLVGPVGNKKTCYQPCGGKVWQRFGLNVVGKFPDGDEWLHPFHSPSNWWRAFHGTGKAGLEGITKDASKIGGVMRESGSGKLGSGVYVTPHLEYAAKSYSGIASVGNKKFVMVFQCAVQPGTMIAEGYPGAEKYQNEPLLKSIFNDRGYGQQNSEWTFASENVRPYGILLADADNLSSLFGGDVGTWK